MTAPVQAPASVPALDFVFHPRSIAIAGVSAKETATFAGAGSSLRSRKSGSAVPSTSSTPRGRHPRNQVLSDHA